MILNATFAYGAHVYAPRQRNHRVRGFLATIPVEIAEATPDEAPVALREPRGESRIHICEPRADVYPLLARCDVLITDYSSVFFDFLHAGRPIVFFAYDLERYLRQDRSMYFGYERIAPGPICRSQADLEDALLACRNNADGDPFARRRAELLEWAFAPVDGQRLDRIASYL